MQTRPGANTVSVPAAVIPIPRNPSILCHLILSGSDVSEIFSPCIFLSYSSPNLPMLWEISWVMTSPCSFSSEFAEKEKSALEEEPIFAVVLQMIWMVPTAAPVSRYLLSSSALSALALSSPSFAK